MQEILDYVMYHLKQINLDKRLYGGIILTGGGSQMKHLIQLTEYVTGLGARIGQPNEHLAGGHSESLNHPMYATCIGLILRGYSDFETGKLNFNSNNKELEMQQASPAKEVYFKVEIPSTEAVRTESEVEEVVQQSEEKLERNNKRSETIKKVFNQIKNGFMSFFEEPDDQKM